MRTILEDVRFAVRGLARSSGFTMMATTTLSLGIAVNATMFSVVDGVLLQPLGYQDAGRLVAISAYANGSKIPMAFPELFDLRDQARSLSDVAGDKTVTGNITGVDEPERIEVRGVTGSFFTMLGVDAVLGRAFTKADETPGIGPIGVISYGLWQRRFGGARSAIGRTVRIDDDDYMIVGVMPAGFEHPAADPARPIDFWFPSGFRATPFPPLTRRWRVANVFARLSPGVTIGQAQDEVRRLAAEWRTAYPDDYPADNSWELRVRPLHELIVGDLRRPLTILFAAVGIVLLIACANVAGLQLTRQAARASDIAVRRALGAGRWQIARPILVESVVLALAAAACGVALSFGGVALVRGLAPVSMPRTGSIAVHLPVLLFAVTAAVGTGVTFGLVPALAATRVALGEMLRTGPRTGTGVAAARFRTALVVGELALALVLLSGAGLLVRSFAGLHRVDLGFRIDRLLTMELTVPYPNDVGRAKYMEPAPRVRLYAEVLRRVRDVAGVADAAMTSSIPLTSAVNPRLVTPAGARATTEADGPRVESISVSDGCFRAMGIPLLGGREFTTSDNAAGAPVAIVSETAAHRLWPGADPIGKRFKIGGTRSDGPWITVVGLVRDVRSSGLEQPSPGQMYGAYLQSPPRPVHLVVRSQARAEPLAEPVRRVVREVESDQPVYAVRTMEQILGNRLAERRFAMVSLTVFSGLAVLLAAFGLYAVVSFTVAQRTREIGVRMALGGTRLAMARLVLRDALRLAAIGTAVGMMGVLVSGRVLSGLLYGVTPTDPPTLVLTALGIIAVGTVASLVPGSRAAAVDPIAALRNE